MPLVEAKCTNCGSVLTVDNAKEAAVCQYCGTPFVVEKAINYYTVSNNIQAQVVNVYESAGSDFVIRGGVLEEYRGNNSDVALPEGIVKIGDNAFENMVGITSVVMSSKISDIGKCAFSGCTNLSRIEFSNGLRIIGKWAFHDCKQLEIEEIPDGVTEIGDYAFSGCNKIKKITLPQSIDTVGIGIFSECKSLLEADIQGGDAIFPKMFSECASLKRVHVSLKIKALYSDCFHGCSSLESIESDEPLPEDFQLIKDNWEGPDCLVIPNSIESVSGAFDGLAREWQSNIKRILFLNPNCSIGPCSFKNCNVKLFLRYELYNKIYRFIASCVSAYNGSHKYGQVTQQQVTSYYFDTSTSGVLDPDTLNNEYMAFFDLYKHCDKAISIHDIDKEISNKIKIENSDPVAEETKKAGKEKRKVSAAGYFFTFIMFLLAAAALLATAGFITFYIFKLNYLKGTVYPDFINNIITSGIFTKVDGKGVLSDLVVVGGLCLAVTVALFIGAFKVKKNYF